jgi:Spy/CpxP family protein refolding chaperone
MLKAAEAVTAAAIAAAAAAAMSSGLVGSDDGEHDWGFDDFDGLDMMMLL